MKSLVHTGELCSRSVPLEQAPGAKPLVCIGLYVINYTTIIYSEEVKSSFTIDAKKSKKILRRKKKINLWARIGLHSWAYDMDTQFWQPPIDHIHGYPILKDVGWRWPTQLFANINMHVWYSSPLLSTISALPPSECMRFTLGQVTWLLNEKENPWRLPIFYNKKKGA